MKSMNPITFWKRTIEYPATRNPTIPAQEWISEVKFEPYFDESGNKMVQITKGYYEENFRDGSWKYTEADILFVTAAEANQIYSKVKHTKYATQKKPAQLIENPVILG